MARIFYRVFKLDMWTFANTSIILVTTNIAVKLDFAEVVGYFFANDIFGELVLDKIHKVSMSRDFWACIKSIWQIKRLGFSIIDMFGTILVEIESSLRKELCLVKNTTIIYQLLNRFKLKYITNPSLTNMVLVHW